MPATINRVDEVVLDLQVEMRVYARMVSTSYKINEVAKRSGFTPATLRYYEEVGLVPLPTRTEAGYRMYDDRALERLAFIARAKQLGCTLEETADLVVAWEGGECGPIQDRLRSLVADKLVAAQTQIVALTTLTSELQRAAAGLEGHRPDGPCDDDCGCETVSVDNRAPRAVTLSTKPARVADTAPIACSLTSNSMTRRLGEWNNLLGWNDDLRDQVTSRVAVDGGVRLEFTPGIDVRELARLVKAEQNCCRCFSFNLTVDDRGIGLETRAPEDAMAMLHVLFGVPA